MYIVTGEIVWWWYYVYVNKDLFYSNTRVGWPDDLFWEEGSGFGVPKNYIDLMGESCVGCIELPKYRRFLLFPLYRLVTLYTWL